MKRCKKCNQVLKVKKFVCQNCQRDTQNRVMKRYRDKNKERINKQTSINRQTNPYFSPNSASIYCILDKNKNIIRIGSTTKTLHIRKTIYANNAFNVETDTNVSRYLRKIYKNYDDCMNRLELVLIKRVDKSDKLFRLFLEQILIDKHTPILNMRRAISEEDYRKYINGLVR